MPPVTKAELVQFIDSGEFERMLKKEQMNWWFFSKLNF